MFNLMTHHDTHKDGLLTVEQTADRLNLSVRQVWRLVERHVLLTTKINGGTFFSEDDLKNYKKADGNQHFKGQCIRYVYSLLNTITGDRYIGTTMQVPRDRWHNHIAEAKGGSLRPIHVHIREHGTDAFKLEILEELVCDLKEARSREQHFIQMLNPSYNLEIDGTRGKGRGRRMSYGIQLAPGDRRLVDEKLTYSRAADRGGLNNGVELEKLVKAGIINPYISPNGAVFFTNDHVQQIKAFLEGSNK